MLNCLVCVCVPRRSREGGTEAVRVAVRVRPMSEREEAAGLQVGGVLFFLPDGRGHCHTLRGLVLHGGGNGGQFAWCFWVAHGFECL